MAKLLLQPFGSHVLTSHKWIAFVYIVCSRLVEEEESRVETAVQSLMCRCNAVWMNRRSPVAVTARQMIARAEQEKVSSALDRANHVDDIVSNVSNNIYVRDALMAPCAVQYLCCAVHTRAEYGEPSKQRLYALWAPTFGMC